MQRQPQGGDRQAPPASRDPQPRVGRVPPQQQAPARNGQRTPNGSYGPSGTYGGGENRAVPRQYPNSRDDRGYNSRSGGYNSYGRNYVRPSYRSSYFAPRFFYSRPVYQPYYSFRPRLRLSFGLFLGYPVSYPSWYDSYLPSAYSWYRPGMSYGGVSFEIQPYDADIWVDGEYVGIVRDFGPYAAPLTLPAGVHHIDLQAPDYEPLSFDITVLPRQVIPYQGSLPRY